MTNQDNRSASQGNDSSDDILSKKMSVKEWFVTAASAVCLGATTGTMSTVISTFLANPDSSPYTPLVSGVLSALGGGVAGAWAARNLIIGLRFAKKHRPHYFNG